MRSLISTAVALAVMTAVIAIHTSVFSNCREEPAGDERKQFQLSASGWLQPALKQQYAERLGINNGGSYEWFVGMATDPNSKNEGMEECGWVGKFVQSSRPSEINSLRRFLMLHRPDCFEQHLQSFIDAFLSRRNKRHLNLHVPKTGGTSLCELVKTNGISTGKSNCWVPQMCPHWCCCSQLRRLSCADLRSIPLDFIGNERFLDHPICDDDFAYSLTVREAVSRAVSHVQHQLRFLLEERGAPISKGLGRAAESLNLVQSNYVTWTLLSGMEREPLKFVPGEEHLEDAKRVLSRFDYIINITPQNATRAGCNHLLFKMMGMNDVMVGHDTQGSVVGYRSHYREQSYEALNKVDSRLYNFALELIDADCRFLLRIADKVQSIPANNATSV